MSRTRTAIALLLAATCIVGAHPPLSAASNGTSESAVAPIPVLPTHVFLLGRSGMVVRDAVNGAIERIRRPRCESLIGELRDTEGRPLAWNLSLSGMGAADYLAHLRFVEGDGLDQCTLETNVALTQPRNRVIFICGLRFTRYFATQRRDSAAIVIHEFLHSLGLGENPPTSAEITQMVIARCGD